MSSATIENRQSKTGGGSRRTIEDRAGRLARQYFMVFVVLLGGGLIVSGVLELYFRYGESRQQIAVVQGEIASNAARRIAQFILTIEEHMKAATVSSVVARQGIGPEYQFELAKLLTTAPAITELLAVGADGRVRAFVSRFRVALNADEQNLSKAASFLQAKQGVTFFGPVSFVDESEPSLAIAVPIEQFSGHVIGTLQAQVDLRQIWEVVRELKFSDTGYAYIVSRAGDMIAHSNPGLVLQRLRAAHLTQVRMAFQPNPVAPIPRTTVAEDFAGQDVLSSFVFLPNLDWAVFVEQPLSEAHKSLYGSILRTSTLLLIGLATALVASVFVARRVVRPLEALRRGVERIGAGDLNHRIEIATGNEIEVLADEFNKMAGEIKNAYQGLEDKVQQRTKELTALLDVAATATQSFDIDTVLRQVAGKIADIFELDAVLIYLFEANQIDLRVRASAGYTTEGFAQKLFTRGQGIVGKVAETGEPILFADAHNDPSYLAIAQAALQKNWPSVFLPAFRSNRREGSWAPSSAMAGRRGKLTEPEHRLLTSMADQIGPAIDNVNLFEEAKSKSAELERRNHEVVDALERQTAVAEMLRTMARTLSDWQFFFDTMIADTVRLTRATGGVIRLADNNGALRHVAHICEGEHRLQDIERLPLPADESGAAIQAFRQQRPVQISDILAQPSPVRVPISTATRTVLAVPLLQEGAAIGVIVVFRHFVEPFSAPQIELVTTFADQAVVAINNINLFQQLQARSRELESANDRLKELDKLKSGFVSNVSHELRTPLTAIGGLVDNMLDGLTGPLNPKQSHYISGIKDSTERLARLIHDMLDLSVIESGRMELKLTRFPMAALISEIVDNLRPVSLDKDIELGGNSASGEYHVWADRDKITQVLTNLVSNAVKFTPSGGKVKIFLEPVASGYWLQVGVGDNGPGIPPEEAGRIFDEFYQISQPGQEKAKGVGLGLAICKKLIDMHGGQIRVESAPGAGSTFYFTVPAHVEQPAQVALN